MSTASLSKDVVVIENDFADFVFIPLDELDDFVQQLLDIQKEVNAMKPTPPETTEAI